MEEKGAKPDGSWPTFQYSEDANARSVLGTVANRLRRIGESSRRMEWDKPPISLGDYIARLRSRKQQLSRTILDAERTRPKTGRPGPLFQARPTRTMAPLPIDGGRRFELSGRELQVASESWRELAGECRTYEGRVAPVTWWAEDSKKYVTHDSECGAYVQYGYPDETFFRGTGYMEIYQHLYDDASIWRDDTPDSYRVDFAVGWELPRPNCDALITCTIDVVHHVNFTNGADDGGYFATTVSLVHSDEEGQFGTYCLFDIQSVLLGSLGGENVASGRYDSGPQSPIQIRFRLPKNSKPRVCLGHHFFLSAQDGLVSLVGDCGTHTPPETGQYGYGCGPLLRYSMVPDPGV